MRGIKTVRSSVEVGRRYIRRAKNVRTVGITSAILLFYIVITTIFPIVFHEEQVEATANPADPPILTITSTNPATTVEVTPTLNGTFAASSSDIAFNVTTNNLTGYNLSIVGSDNNGLLSNTVSGSVIDTLSPLSAATSAATFSSSSSYNGKWGYKPSKLNSSANTDYLPAPGTSGTTIDVTSAANATATSATSYTIGLAARVDDTKPAGTYTNSFTLNVVGNTVPYLINYRDNSSGTDEVLSYEQSSNLSIASFTLSATTPTRTGYTFNKWCDGIVTHVAFGDSTCSGTTYSSGATYYLTNPSAVSLNTVNLYAMWNVNTYRLTINFAGIGVSGVQVRTGSGTSGTLKGTVSTSGGYVSGLTYGVAYYLRPIFSTTEYELDSWANIGAYGTLSSTTATNPTFTMGAGNGTVRITGKSNIIPAQNLDPSECTTTARTVVDERDGQNYTIKRLDDGRCWMITNLNLGATALTTNLNSTNTNITGTISASEFNGWVMNSLQVSYTSGSAIPQSGTDSTSGTPYGTLYNFYAASGGTISGNANREIATQDICPAGWRLPTGSRSGELWNLYLQPAYNSAALMHASIANGGAGFAFPGYYLSPDINVVTGQGEMASYHTSTDRAYSASDAAGTMFHLYMLDTTGGNQLVETDNGDVSTMNRALAAQSIRCILKTPEESTGLGSMQDIGHMTSVQKTALLDRIGVGQNYTVTDSRDGKSYTVARMLDGKLWMTQNLAFGENELYSDSSNIPAGYTTSNPYYIEATTHVWGDLTTTGNNYNTPLLHSDNNYQGYWYNFAGATARTITGSSNSSDVEYDICPAGWRLPSGDEATTITSPATSYQFIFRSINGTGMYRGKTFQLTSNGYWWTSAYRAATTRLILTRNSSGVLVTGNGVRYDGYNIRCVLK